MNERITAIRDEALTRAWQQQLGMDGTMAIFAELIVRECAALVQGVPTDTMGYHTADQKIKEHFGVEE